ncbi:hypothetical protein SK128_019944, partial [Halocaridina rubra]
TSDTFSKEKRGKKDVVLSPFKDLRSKKPQISVSQDYQRKPSALQKKTPQNQK